MSVKNLFAGSLIAAGVASANAVASPTFQVNGGGGSTVYFSNQLLNALDAAGVEIEAVKPARLAADGRRIRIPHSGGAFDLDGVIGELNHRGGLTLRGFDGETVTFYNLVVEAIAGETRVTGLIALDGDLVARAPLFEIENDPEDDGIVGNNRLRLRGVVLLLTDEAAELLDSVLGVALEPDDRAAVFGTTVKLRVPAGQDLDDDDDDLDDDDDDDDEDLDDDDGDDLDDDDEDVDPDDEDDEDMEDDS